MLTLPVIRWGQAYESLDVAEVTHFATGEPIARVCQAGGGIIKRDMRQAQQARDALRQIPCRELIAMLGQARPTSTKTGRCRSATAPSRRTISSISSRPARACPSTCAGPTWPRTLSCSRTWRRFSTASRGGSISRSSAAATARKDAV